MQTKACVHTNRGSWSHFRKCGPTNVQQTESVQPAGQKTEPVQRENKEAKRRGQNEASCREQRGFCLVTKRNKSDCSWCRLVRLVSTWGAGCAGAKHQHWRCGARSQRGWSSWCSARTRTQMLTVLFVKDPAPLFSPPIIV